VVVAALESLPQPPNATAPLTAIAATAGIANALPACMLPLSSRTVGRHAREEM
jgi:hypothetical protein